MVTDEQRAPGGRDVLLAENAHSVDSVRHHPKEGAHAIIGKEITQRDEAGDDEQGDAKRGRKPAGEVGIGEKNSGQRICHGGTPARTGGPRKRTVPAIDAQ